MNRTLVAGALVVAAGCHRHGSGPPPGRAIARQLDTCWSYWNDASWDQLATCYAPDAVREEPGTGHPPARGRDAIVASAKLLEAAVPGLKGEPMLELVDENHVVSIVLVHGIAPTGREVGMLVSQVLEVGGDGRVQRVAMYADLAALHGLLAASSGREARAPLDARPHHERVAISTGDETERVNGSVVPQLIYLLNRHDLADLDTVLDDDLVWSDAAGPTGQDGAGLRATLAQLWTAVPDARFRATSLYRAGNYVAIAGTFEGTLRGAHVVVPYDAIHELEGGKIIRSWVFFQGTARGITP